MAARKNIPTTPIDGERLRKALAIYKKQTGKSATWLSYKVSESGSMLSNAMLRDRIPTQYIPALEIAGIHADDYVIKEEADGPQDAQEAPQEANEGEIRGSDQDLRKEVQRLRDDLADLRTILNALREERQRDEEKLLQAISRLTEAQLTQRQIGEEIVSGIILAMGQINIDEPTRSAYAAIRKGLKADIYRAMKGEIK